MQRTEEWRRDALETMIQPANKNRPRIVEIVFDELHRMHVNIWLRAFRFTALCASSGLHVFRVHERALAHAVNDKNMVIVFVGTHEM